jgi:hypothetical protein
MKAENKAPVIEKPRSHRLIEFKPVAASAWTPQPGLLTREEIRKIVIDQIG